MSNPHPNTVLIINKAKNTIKIDRDPNFDDMILIFDDIQSQSPYELSPEKQVYVGSTYVSDMGLCLTYNGDERFMDVGDGQPAGLSPGFQVISDSEDGGGGPLVYTPTDATANSITLTFKDKS